MSDIGGKRTRPASSEPVAESAEAVATRDFLNFAFKLAKAIGKHLTKDNANENENDNANDSKVSTAATKQVKDRFLSSDDDSDDDNNNNNSTVDTVAIAEEAIAKFFANGDAAPYIAEINNAISVLRDSRVNIENLVQDQARQNQCLKLEKYILRMNTISQEQQMKFCQIALIAAEEEPTDPLKRSLLPTIPLPFISRWEGLLTLWSIMLRKLQR